jgi:hypothetical protein
VTRAQAVSLTDKQLRVVQQHAASLPIGMRDRYLREIVDRLCGTPSDTAVEAAINLALDRCYVFSNGI